MSNKLAKTGNDALIKTLREVLSARNVRTKVVKVELSPDKESWTSTDIQLSNLCELLMEGQTIYFRCQYVTIEEGKSPTLPRYTDAMELQIVAHEKERKA